MHVGRSTASTRRSRISPTLAGDVEGAGVPADKGIKLKPEVSMIEVSAIEREHAFMTLRSSKRKYAPPPPTVAEDAAAPPAPATLDPQPGPPPAPTHVNPNHVAAGPSAYDAELEAGFPRASKSAYFEYDSDSYSG